MDAIRNEVFGGGAVVVDLRPCSRISAAACLMLCAELERCQTYRPGSIETGYDPNARTAAELLRKFRFHDHLGFSDRPPRRANNAYIRIQSGKGAVATTSQRLKQVAAIAKAESPRFVEDVLQSLLEALYNITGHAYNGADPERCVLGRWWFAGVAYDHKLRFYAFDQGVGIARTAPSSMADALQEYAQQGNRLHNAAFAHGRERDVLEAACRSRRLGIDVGGPGRGFPEMISLIEKHGVDGRLDVISGRARYTFRHHNGNALESSAGLRYEAPGTLIAWTISLPGGPGSKTPH